MTLSVIYIAVGSPANGNRLLKHVQRACNEGDFVVCGGVAAYCDNVVAYVAALCIVVAVNRRAFKVCNRFAVYKADGLVYAVVCGAVAVEYRLIICRYRKRRLFNVNLYRSRSADIVGAVVYEYGNGKLAASGYVFKNYF